MTNPLDPDQLRALAHATRLATVDGKARPFASWRQQAAYVADLTRELDRVDLWPANTNPAWFVMEAMAHMDVRNQPRNPLAPRGRQGRNSGTFTPLTHRQGNVTPMGRTTRLTPQVQERICEALRTGLHRHRAALYGGISEHSFYRWLQQGDPDTDLDEPDLTNMATTTLRKTAEAAGLTAPPKATRDQLVALLEAEGLGSWSIYRAFRQAVDEAELECEVTLVSQWRLIAPDNPNAIRDLLSRRFKHWSQPLQVTGADGGPIQLTATLEETLASTVQAYLRGIGDRADAIDTTSKTATSDQRSERE